MSKGARAAFYKSKAWKECRDSYMRSVGGLCEDCLAKHPPEYTPAEIVHHIIHLDDDNLSDATVSLNFKNLRAVCRACHKDEHKELKMSRRQRWRRDANGNIEIIDDDEI